MQTKMLHRVIWGLLGLALLLMLTTRTSAQFPPPSGGCLFAVSGGIPATVVNVAWVADPTKNNLGITYTLTNNTGQNLATLFVTSATLNGVDWLRRTKQPYGPVIAGVTTPPRDIYFPTTAQPGDLAQLTLNGTYTYKVNGVTVHGVFTDTVCIVVPARSA